MQTLHSGSGSRGAAWFTGIAALAICGTLGGVMVASGLSVLIVIGAVLICLALMSVAWQLADARRRRHELTDRGLRYRCGILGRFDVEIPYGAIRGVAVRQGIWQRPLACADVRVAVPGMAGPVLLSPRDYNSVVLRSIPDFEAVAGIIRERAGAA